MIKKRKKKEKDERLKISAVMNAELPSAIMSRINPLFTSGAAAIALAIVTIFLPSLRRISPLFLLVGLLITGYAFWQKKDVIKRGYDEHVFKVIDYTYITPIATRLRNPTGILLMKTEESDPDVGNMYHVAVSGKSRNLPPIDWLLRVYVPKGSEAVEYGDRKYFPVVYGYKVEGEDKKV